MKRFAFLAFLAFLTLVASVATTAVGVSAAPAAWASAGGQHPIVQQRGMTLWAWWPDAYATATSDAAISQMASDGARWVVLVPEWFQATPTSSTFAPTSTFTPTDASIVHAVQTAKRLGMKVMLKPQIDVSDGISWRGQIQPANLDQWFATYGQFLGHYAALAASASVDQLAVGTELEGVSGQTARWQSLISVTRHTFHGTLTYAALYFEYQNISFWNALDFIGVDAYWPLATVPTTDVPTLVAAWAPIVSQLSATSAHWGKPILFTEAGYASQVGTTTDPSSWSLSTTPAPLEQAAAYQALLTALSPQPWFAGVDWWAWRVTNLTDPLDFTPQGKPAEQVLQTAWR
jgi:hypothetical protein